jgi:nickel-dependent lactate racemase
VEVRLAYGKQGLRVSLPDRNVTVIEPVFVEGLPDEKAAVLESIRSPIGTPPLRDMVRPQDTVAIVFCDITRPMPSRRVLPVILNELAHVDRGKIVLINALGTHRPSPRQELVELLGEEIVRDYRIIQHSCEDRSSLARAGTLADGEDLWVNKEYLNSSFRILTGFIEPHFFAGFSGGGKLVLPGIASIENIMRAHSYEILSDARSTWGVTEGNPVFERIREAAELTHPDFILNVTLNKNKEITQVFSGDLRQAHGAGVDYQRSVAMRAVPHPFDVVITTNSGYPLDRNLYQTVKGMSAAAEIVRDGGTIIAAAECRDGIPKGSKYESLLSMAGTPDGTLKMVSTPGFAMTDQWQVQIQAKVQKRAKVYLKSDGLTDEEIRSAMLVPCQKIEDAVEEALGELGSDASICVLPEGPQTIPYVWMVAGDQ